MKRLIIQTYIEDNQNRPHVNTYVSRPKLEAASRKNFERYANMVGADYEYCTEPTGAFDYNRFTGAHWLRMEMFYRPDYDEVLYVDCDVLIYPHVFTNKENIFDDAGVGSGAMHEGSNRKLGWLGGVNGGVLKYTREECEVMGKHIHKYYHPTHNQESLNNCYRDHLGSREKPYEAYLPYKWNVTHWDSTGALHQAGKPIKSNGVLNFRHYAGHWKDPKALKACPLYKHWK